MILDELDHVLRAHPDRPAILGANLWGRPVVRATCADLATLSDRYSSALHRRGLVAGETVGLAVRPGPRALAIMLAARRLGLRVAVLDPSAGPDVLAARLALASPALVLADAVAQAVAGWARPLARRAHLGLPDLAKLAPVATVGRRLPGYAATLEAGATTALPANRAQSNADAVVLFTSGTTGRPRAVVHTWGSLDAGMRAVAQLVRPEAGRPVVGGTSFVLVPSLANGAPVALPARGPKRLARQLHGLRPQHTYLTPPQVRAVLAARGRFTGQVWSGSAPVTADLLGRVRDAGASRAHGVYALTEMFPVAVVEAVAKAHFAGQAGDLVGDLIPGVRAHVDGAGELMLAGPSACARYLGEPPLTWIATGDLARFDDTRRVVLGGRCKDMILRGEQNVYPGLYEPSLHVPGVNLAVLVGVPAGDGDQRVVALVEQAPGADPSRVRASLREQLRRMGSARPDAVVFGPVPLSGRSRKPDRCAAARLAAHLASRSDR